MNSKKFMFLSGFIVLILVTTFIAFAEESTVTSTSPIVAAADQQGASKSGDTQWAWGEVTNLDAQAKTFTLKYLDYETDQEKELVLAIDDKTTFENIKSLDEIKIKDTLSIDYAVGIDNKNIAKNISLEKPDAVSHAPVQTSEAVKPVETPLITEQPAVVSAPPTAVPETQPVAQPEASVASTTEAAQPATPAEAAQSETPTAPDEVALPIRQNQSSGY